MKEVARFTPRYSALEIKIAGGGLIGRMLGWHFVRQGEQVTVYEKDGAFEPTSAAHVSASMLAPQSERPESNATVWQMAMESLDLWPKWLIDLDVPYGFDGSVVVAHPGDESLLRKFETSLRRHKIGGFQCLSQNDIHELEPDLANRFRKGILLEQEGWLDNRALLKALAHNCGSIKYNSEVNPYELQADLVVDCRGMGSDDPDLRGVRGEVIRLHAPSVRLSRPVRLLHPKYRLYVAPRSEDQFVIGATQLESEFVGGVTVQSALELLTTAYSIHDGFEEAEIVELGAGLRPAYPDNTPRIYWRNGVLSVNGLYRHGFLIAPAVVNQAAEEVYKQCASF
ncbi:MAG: FAD-dependent oxidoreductase [Gammaproteobacteria bacterium]|nr:FAD-dependent oxidoreductase [Gammaproteobacteria bacterium]